MNQFDFFFTIKAHLTLDALKLVIDNKWQLCELTQFFSMFLIGIICLCYDSDRLLLHGLMDKFDTLPLQYMHIGHLHEVVRWQKINY